MDLLIDSFISAILLVVSLDAEMISIIGVSLKVSCTSTFFAALIGTYIVLRFGAVSWPSTHDVHLVEFLGFINTFILICSSVTMPSG